MRKHGLLLGAFILSVFPATGFSQRTADSACILCHQDVDLLGEESAAIVEAFQGDVHRDAGLSCHDCHGGNPDPAHPHRRRERRED